MGLNGVIMKECKERLKATPDTLRPSQESHWGFLLSRGSLGPWGVKSRGHGALASTVAPHLLVVLLQALVILA